MMSLVWIAQLASTLFMTGLIWFVQIVHYPLFAQVGRDGFASYELAHSRLTGWVVAPVMLVELATAIWLIAFPSSSALAPAEVSSGALPRAWLWAGLALLVGVWASTFALQVPAHGVLSGGFDAAAHRRLVDSNWIRTVLWTARAALVLWLVSRAGVDG